MALTNGPNLGLLVNGNAGEGHYTELMRQWRGLDALVMPVVKGYLINTPPGSPTDGDLYIVGTYPTGAWAAKNNQIARWSSVASAWEFFVPKTGWKVVDGSVAGAAVYSYTCGVWTSAVRGASTIYAKGGGTPGAGYQLDACTIGWDPGTGRGWIQSGGASSVSDLLIQANGGVAIFGSGGINLGQTDLKNYQEGTWTPTLATGWTNTGTPAIVGRFVRIGKWCRCYFHVGGSDAGGSGTVSFASGATITGVPFTPETAHGYSCGTLSNNNGGSRVADIFLSTTTVYMIGSGGANSYAYTGMFDFFI